MTRKPVTTNGFEYDWCSGWRHCYNWNSGVSKRMKRGMNKRFRRQGKTLCREIE